MARRRSDKTSPAEKAAPAEAPEVYTPPPPPADPNADRTEPRLWKMNGWICRVIKNEDDDGWAVSMTRIGDDEPALIGPWTMGRDKKNPKPLDQTAFLTLVKTAQDVIRRHEHHEHARRHRKFTWTRPSGQRVQAALDLSEDEYDPEATLTLRDDRTAELLAQARVRPDLRLNAATLERYLPEDSPS
jgi:hypothetical protein